MNDTSKEVLETVVEIVENLETFSFDEHVKKTGLGFNACRDDNDEWIINFSLPKDEKLQAFLFRFRLFIQRNEPISFYNLRNLFSDSTLSGSWKNGVEAAIQSFEDYSKAYPIGIEKEFFGKLPTNGEVLDVVLNGGFGHTGLNPKYKHKRQTFQKWACDEIRGSVLFQIFTQIVLIIYQLLISISELCKIELENSKVIRSL
ncbi:MAG: hypothetical protein M5U11_07985 [Anaerolineales bacterium]|nr:hypothetical protein [Anaerolineales bacterium]MDX9936720.1 hypothetical protein [Anaerolineales bacterium]GER81117.1 hypothetical protein DIM_31980 [Candidatus Denitrolinea symbiosum]